MSQRPRRYGALTRAAVATTASLSLVAGVATAALTIRWIQVRDVGTDRDFRGTAPSGVSQRITGKCTEEACNYLLLGSDSRAGLSAEQFGTNEDIGGRSRADTIMLVHTDPRLKKAIVLSFPRDLWVDIPGHGADRINTAFEGGIKGGGPQLMAQTVSDLTGLSIDHYLYVDLDGFRRVVDTLGGVDMCIPAYNVNTPGWLTATAPNGEPTQVYVGDVGRIADPNAGLNIEPGCQRLDGFQALAYVRARHLPCDHVPDFSRIGRQQQFLRSVVNQMLQPSVVVRAPALVTPVLENLRRDDDFLPSDLVYLVGQLRGLTTGAVEFRTVPGVAAYREGKSVLRMDPSARKIFAAIHDGRAIGGVGTRLVNTPPSEANTVVAVVDADSGGKANGVAGILADAGFDVTPGIWDASEGPDDVRDAAIAYRQGDEAHAQVVSAYFPGLPIVESSELRGAHVAVVIPASYVPVVPGNEENDGDAARCPAA
jgi:anionic cell wall polymer biosynthesis LytR-Cps2A-Psr (LCP) family protein